MVYQSQQKQTKLQIFLDIQLNLSKNNYSSYRKYNDNPMYINISSNNPHPANEYQTYHQTKKEVFGDNINIYKETVSKSGFPWEPDLCQRNTCQPNDQRQTQTKT